jgi:tetratricopeptide (TPR) repeat protein
MTIAGELDALTASVVGRLSQGRAPSELAPDFARLARMAPEGSSAWRLAHVELARLAMESDPWRGSVLARRVTKHHPYDHEAWGLLGLGQSLLGHHRFAIRAYERARALAPSNPYYAHNLGHLYDVVTAELPRALELLRQAARALPDHPDVLLSLAHALARAREVREARRVLARAARLGSQGPEHLQLARQLATLGAPQRAAAGRGRAGGSGAEGAPHG